MRESLEDMMRRVNEEMPGKHWIQTSVGLVNMKNKAAALRAGKKLMDLRESQKNSSKENKNAEAE